MKNITKGAGLWADLGAEDFFSIFILKSIQKKAWDIRATEAATKDGTEA